MSTPCPACGADNRDKARFCRNCGRTLTPGDSLPPVAASPQAAPRPASPFTAPAKIQPLQKAVVEREERVVKSTVLHSAKVSAPVCGWLVVLRGPGKGDDFRIDKAVSVLGRDPSCDFVIEDEAVSRHHARIRVEGEQFVLFDLGSGNGTFLNGARVQRADLEDGDVLKVGDSLVLFKEAKPRIPLDQADVPPGVS